MRVTDDEYGQRALDREDAVFRALERTPLAEAARAGRAPAVIFTCPAGHALPALMLGILRTSLDPMGLHLWLLRAPGASQCAAMRMYDGGDWRRAKRFGRSGFVCLHKGCRRQVKKPGRGAYCNEHGPEPLDRPDRWRTAFECTVCGWTDVFTTPRLLELYAAAALRGQLQVTLTTGRPTRR